MWWFGPIQVLNMNISMKHVAADENTARGVKNARKRFMINKWARLARCEPYFRQTLWNFCSKPNRFDCYDLFWICRAVYVSFSVIWCVRTVFCNEKNGDDKDDDNGSGGDASITNNCNNSSVKHPKKNRLTKETRKEKVFSSRENEYSVIGLLVWLHHMEHVEDKALI